ncbi:MAG TPA: endolytic transglycosylase MltG, partial [Devosiaceae bacterium]|nr:endolytic transglycosylase MltG [Devosiaceae bacterium]
MNAKSRREKKRRGQKSSNPVLRVLNGVLMLIVLGVVVVVLVVVIGMNRFYADGPLAEDTIFMVERGSGLSTIAGKLADAGIVADALTFRFGGVALRKQNEIKAGEFRIAARSSMSDVLREITEGRPIIYQVTIPEGFTSWQVAERLRADEFLTGEIEAVPAEGTLLPNTYAYERG